MVHVVPSTIFPRVYQMSAWNHDVMRFEGDVYELEVIGSLPTDLHGAFYRVQPDHAFPPMFGEDEIPLNGDGNICCFYFENGHVDFKNRYVRTPKFEAERAARRALFGRYRNKYTDDPRVRDVLTRTTANTHVIYHANKIMALKEDAPPFEIDASTLETVGLVNYNNTFHCPTHTAHPKADSDTGELVAFGYEAKGDGSPDICSFTVDKEGYVTEEVWFKAPWACMIHDFWATENYVIFPINGLKASVEQMQKGGEHFYWDENLDHQLLGVIPRRGAKPEDVKWFKTSRGCYSHTINAYEEDGNLVLDANVWTDCVFPFFPNSQGKKFHYDPKNIRSPVLRYRFDPKGSTEVMVHPQQVIQEGVNEFGRVDDRLLGKKYDRYWILTVDPTKQIYSNGTAAQAGFNTLLCHNFKTGKKQTYYHGNDVTFQEPCFVPRSGGASPEEGYIVILADLYRESRSQLLLFDAQNIDKGPIAQIKLPLKLLDGLHGSWVDGKDVDLASKGTTGKVDQ
ncbi:carotenoid oxygenase [Aaosphaeria arxii CBS 175.79]|uniref:Carotenoid oxygenase n=1 Tax=Aaosphaeria arxii CBS 175.79 TaxID=1450172 RepID=A0A6A5X7J7_9PLEO|nr:carotenoid oxygenase [Aaosphaeria arxii CBS 175.79]KAF2008787.1 carotenoid oxygenase [Aaosphaeria arxii CBS 175.79]